MPKHEKLNYVEFAAKDLEATKAFFKTVFNWQFEDFGSDYCAFSEQGLDGGFYRKNLASVSANGSALLIFYSDDLESTLAKVTAADAIINKSIFSFPGGERFHFIEPSGNEFAVWSDM